MRIWIDLANSPHVPFFRPLINEFRRRNHEVVITARAFAETVELAQAAGLAPEVIGGHGGGKLSGKAGNLVGRALALARWARGRDLHLAVSHNSYSQILAARALSLRTVTLMDYEHQPANHLAFRFASRIIVPSAFPESALTRFGAAPAKVKRYNGLKEDVYLANFQIDPEFEKQLRALGVNASDVLVTVRPPASEALYHRFENELFDQLIARLAASPSVKILLLPRNDAQRKTYTARASSAAGAVARPSGRAQGSANLIVPPTPLDGANLIAHSDLVVSAGGTMNREAAALGVPAASIYLGEWAAIDEALVNEGRLRRITTAADVADLPVQKKTLAMPRRATHIASEVADLILAD
jgi:predicted glycosyltransferase